MSDAMKNFLILLLAIRLSTSDKLDRTYLPPPGAKFSGGSPEELEVPLEFPKESYQTSIEPQSKPKYEDPIFDLTLPIGKHNKDVKNTTDEYSNIPSNPNAFNEVTTRIYSADDSYETTLDSNQDFSQHSGQQSGPISYQTSSEADYYQNHHPNNLEMNTQIGNPPNLPLNQFFKYQNTANVQKDNISGTPELETIMPDFEMGAFTTDNKDRHLLQTYPSKNDLHEFGKFMLSNTENVFPVYGQNNNNEGYRAYVKYNLNEPELTTVNITPSDNFLEDVSLTYLSLNMQETGKGNVNTENIIRNRPERPQAAADRSSVILNYKNVIAPEGFAYSFDSSNGIHSDESGTAVDGVKAQGSFSYTGDDGKVYSVNYTADENGFQPHGDHLPTPPPVPKFVQQLIEAASRDKEVGNSDNGSYDEAKYGYKKYQGAMDYYSPEMQSINLESINRYGSKRKMNSYSRPVTVGNNKPMKYEGYTETPYDNGSRETDYYNNQLSQLVTDKLAENDKIFKKSDYDGPKSLMKAKIPVPKAYTIDINQHNDTFKETDTGDIQDKQTMQPEPTNYNKYYDGNLEINKNILQGQNKNTSPVYKLNDDEINLSLVNFNETYYGALNSNKFSFYGDLNSGYHYEKPDIKFSYEFNKFQQENTNQDGNHKYINEDKLPISNKILETGIGGRLQTTFSPYQQYIQHDGDLKLKAAMTQEENVDNNNSEILEKSSYFLVSSTTPMSSQSSTLYNENESTTMKVYPTKYKTSIIPITDDYDGIKATEYTDEIINLSAVPARSEIFNALVNRSGNVILDIFGRPLTTEQPDRELTGYVYGPATINEKGGIYSNLPSTVMNEDKTEYSEVYPFIVPDNPYNVIKDKKIQEAGRIENQGILGRPLDFAGLSTRMFDDNLSTTGRLIGEDFSGPKQAQSYDPETGYIYK